MYVYGMVQHSLAHNDPQYDVCMPYLLCKLSCLFVHHAQECVCIGTCVMCMIVYLCLWPGLTYSLEVTFLISSPCIRMCVYEYLYYQRDVLYIDLVLKELFSSHVHVCYVLCM